jgi:hypothetical protein
MRRAFLSRGPRVLVFFSFGVAAGGAARAESEAIVCAPARSLPSGRACVVNPGGAAKLISGDVLAPSGLIEGGQVLVDAAGQIACVGCNCAA